MSNNSFEQQAIKAGEAYIATKTDTLTALLSEIEAEGYTDVNQVIVSIHSQIDGLNKLKGESNE